MGQAAARAVPPAVSGHRAVLLHRHLFAPATTVFDIWVMLVFAGLGVFFYKVGAGAGAIRARLRARTADGGELPPRHVYFARRSADLLRASDQCGSLAMTLALLIVLVLGHGAAQKCSRSRVAVISFNARGSLFQRDPATHLSLTAHLLSCVIVRVRPHVGGRRDAVRHVEEADHRRDVPDIAFGKACAAQAASRSASSTLAGRAVSFDGEIEHGALALGNAGGAIIHAPSARRAADCRNTAHRAPCAVRQ